MTRVQSASFPKTLPTGLTPANLSSMSETHDSAHAAKPGKSQSIWDNDLPAGDSPPLPGWPLTASIVAYVLWMIFLVGMMVLRLAYPG